MHDYVVERIAFFQQVARTITSAAAPDETIELSTIKSLIERFSLPFSSPNKYPKNSHLSSHSYITRHAPELSALQSSRRPNRPSSAREDLLKQRISQEEREYEAGFWIPDIQNQETLSLLGEWNGEWTSLARLKFVRMTRGGMLKESRFPPKGES